MKILVTGSAGFIGYHLASRLLDRGDEVVGLDNINDYYDRQLKYARLAEAGIEKDAIRENTPVVSDSGKNYRFVQADLADADFLLRLFEEEKFDAVCNLAAQAGVRYSLTNPGAYLKSNVDGFLNLLECCRHHPVGHLVYASSSSVYGLNETYPLSTEDNVDHPVSLYAATKKSDELMAHAYSHLYGIPSTGLRFFTVYGPWGRPDMALFLFTEAMLKGEPIDVFNRGEMYRDFTYIDDIVEGVVRVIDRPARPDPEWSGKLPKASTSPAPWRIYNIGNQKPVKLLDFIRAVEEELGKKAEMKLKPMQAGDVKTTHADVRALEQAVGYRPSTDIRTGVRRFIEWYKSYYGID